MSYSVASSRRAVAAESCLATWRLECLPRLTRPKRQWNRQPAHVSTPSSTHMQLLAPTASEPSDAPHRLSHQSTCWWGWTTRHSAFLAQWHTSLQSLPPHQGSARRSQTNTTTGKREEAGGPAKFFQATVKQGGRPTLTWQQASGGCSCSNVWPPHAPGSPNT